MAKSSHSAYARMQFGFGAAGGTVSMFIIVFNHEVQKLYCLCLFAREIIASLH